MKPIKSSTSLNNELVLKNVILKNPQNQRKLETILQTSLNPSRHVIHEHLVVVTALLYGYSVAIAKLSRSLKNMYMNLYHRYTYLQSSQSLSDTLNP